MAAHKAMIRRFPDEAINRTHLTLLDKIPPNVRYRQHRLWTNWAGTARCRPAFTFYPRYVEDLIQIVQFAQATGRKIRVAATGHSWSALVPTAEILVWVHQLNRVTMDLSDESHPRVVIESGATVKEVNDVLEQQGYALPLNVVLEGVRFGGLIATGSHGSGWNNRTLSDLVSSIVIVTASGQLFVLFIFAQGSHFFSSVAVPNGRPAERWFDWTLGMVALIYAIGPGIGWRRLFRREELFLYPHEGEEL